MAISVYRPPPQHVNAPFALPCLLCCAVPCRAVPPVLHVDAARGGGYRSAAVPQSVYVWARAARCNPGPDYDHAVLGNVWVCAKVCTAALTSAEEARAAKDTDCMYSTEWTVCAAREISFPLPLA